MKIAVLVSGGVDSSVALALLKEQGHELTAFYLKIWLEDELSYLGDCPWQEDLAYVEAVCQQLEVPLKVVSLQKEYWDTVVAYTVAEIKAGRTPNPDMMCNQRVKFGVFYDYFGAEFDKVATGHYATISSSPNHDFGDPKEFQGESQLKSKKPLASQDKVFYLKKAPDAVKDQTYFLATLSQEQLSKALFPIGHLTKAEVRALAERYNLPNKSRKDSQGICFLGKLKFADFVRHYLGTQAGDIVEYETGKKVGEHQGFWFYTIGQRQGLGLAGGPWYVVDKDVEKNIVYISRTYYDEEKERDSFILLNSQWLASAETKNVTVKLRHGPHVHACVVEKKGDQVVVKLTQRDQGIAPGQFAVFYQDDLCIGAGVIAPHTVYKKV